MAGVINFSFTTYSRRGNIKGNIYGMVFKQTGLINGSVNLAGNNKGFQWDLLYSGLLAHNYKNKYDGYVLELRISENNLKGIFGINRKWGFFSSV